MIPGGTVFAPESRMTSPILGFDRVQTGSGELHVQHVRGSSWNPLVWIFFGRERVHVPINVFVIEHAEGLVLFDAGMSPKVLEPDYWSHPVTRTFMNNIFRFDIGPEDALGHQLEQAGYSPGRIRKAVISHLHFDHAGGIGDILEAELLVSRDAWKHMLGPHPDREAVQRRDIEIPAARWKQIDFEPLADAGLLPFETGYDVMGDGSMVLVPTPGHLEGSMSMFVGTDPPVMFVGDLCYGVPYMMEGRLPGTGEHEQLLDSWAKVRELKSRLPELLIVPAHDADAADRLSSHPRFRVRA